MSDTYVEVKAIIKDLLGADDAKITPEARFREELEADIFCQRVGEVDETTVHFRRQRRFRETGRDPGRDVAGGGPCGHATAASVRECDGDLGHLH